MRKEFEIYFKDLKSEIQKEFSKFYEIKTEKEGNWDVFPVVVITREVKNQRWDFIGNKF